MDKQSKGKATRQPSNSNPSSSSDEKETSTNGSTEKLVFPDIPQPEAAGVASSPPSRSNSIKEPLVALSVQSSQPALPKEKTKDLGSDNLGVNADVSGSNSSLSSNNAANGGTNKGSQMRNGSNQGHGNNNGSGIGTVQTTTSNLSLHNSFLKSLPADPETTIAEGEPSKLSVFKGSHDSDGDGHDKTVDNDESKGPVNKDAKENKETDSTVPIVQTSTQSPRRFSSSSANTTNSEMNTDTLSRNNSKSKLRNSFSLNNNLKQIEEKALNQDKELNRKNSVQALRKLQNKSSKSALGSSFSNDTIIDDKAANGGELAELERAVTVERSPSRNSGFFTAVWSSATNSLRTPKAANADVPDLPADVNAGTASNDDKVTVGLNVEKARTKNEGQPVSDDPLDAANETTKIISYRKSSRKISTSQSDSRLRSASSASTESKSAVNSPKAIGVTAAEPSNEETEEEDASKSVPVDDKILQKQPSYNPKLYLEEHVYDTKYHFASTVRNNDFHVLFKSVLPEERLIDDFSCALSREILLQGRLYVSDRNICFNANILGWVTNLVVPFGDISSFEKTSTAGLFPNGIAVSTKNNAKHHFATFLSRDNTFEFLNTIWLHYIQKYGGASAQKGSDAELIKDGNDVNAAKTSTEETIFKNDTQHDEVKPSFVSSTPAVGTTSSARSSFEVDDRSSQSNGSKTVLSLSAARFGPNGFNSESYFDYRKRYGKNNDIFLRGLSSLQVPHDPGSFVSPDSHIENGDKEASQDNFSIEEQLLSIDESEDEKDKNKRDSDDDDNEDEEEDDNESNESDGDDEEDENSDYDKEKDDNEDDAKSVKSGEVASEDAKVSPQTPKKASRTVSHPETDFVYDPAANKENILIDEEILDATVPQVFNLLFGKLSDFQHKYINSLSGSEISDIPEFKQLTEKDLPSDAIFAKHLESEKKQRIYSYTKALNFSMGPKSTGVQIVETVEEQDFSKGINIVVKSLTPDVPSGNVFSVQTRYLLAWAKDNKTKFKLSYWMTWTGRSWIKGIIEKSTDSGQKEAAEGLLKLIKAELPAFIEADSASGFEGTVTRLRKGSVKKKKVTGLGSPAIFSANQDANQATPGARPGAGSRGVGKDRSSSLFNLEMGAINDEIEEIEKTLWDILYNNWFVVVIFTALVTILYLQVKIYAVMSETNSIQREQLQLLRQSANRNSFFQSYGRPNEALTGPTEDQLRNQLKLKTEKKLWRYLSRANKGSQGAVNAEKEASTEDPGNKNSKLSDGENKDDPQFQQLKEELNALFENLFALENDQSQNSHSSKGNGKIPKLHKDNFQAKNDQLKHTYLQKFQLSLLNYVNGEGREEHSNRNLYVQDPKSPKHTSTAATENKSEDITKMDILDYFFKSLGRVRDYDYEGHGDSLMGLINDIL